MLISQQSDAGRQHVQPRATAADVNRSVADYIEGLISDLSLIDLDERDELINYLSAVLDEVMLTERQNNAKTARIAAIALVSTHREPSNVSYDDLPRLLVSQFTRGVDLLSAIRVEADQLARCNSEGLAHIEASRERIDRLNADNARMIDLICAG